MSNQPAHKVRIGLVTATIWNNEKHHSVELSRSYRTDEGEWRSVGSFFHGDLLNVAKCLERAEIWISRRTASQGGK